MSQCQNCGLTFRSYYHDGKFSHNIPKDPSLEQKIIRYLKTHEEATDEEIAKGLNEKVTEIEATLGSLQHEGVVYRNK